MAFFQRLRRAFIIFSVEVSLLVFSYWGFLVFNGSYVTGALLGEVLFYAFLTTLFILDYVLVSRRIEENSEIATVLPSQTTKKEQALKYLKVMGNLSSNQLASLLEIDVRNLSKFINPMIQTGILEATKQGKTFLYSLKNMHTLLHTHNRHNSLGETDYAGHMTLPKWDVKLPTEGNVLGRIAVDDWKLDEFFYLPLRKCAQKGILVSGASGSGKTVAAKVIAEELLQDNVPVLVFDYTKQWQRLLEKNTNEEMIKQYRLFGMKTPRAYEGQVLRDLPDPAKITGSAALIIDLSSIMDKADRVEVVAKMLDRLLEYFQFQEDSEELRLLVVVEEAHLWTSKDLPKQAMLFLDNAVRLLRKKGVGMMLVSHKISDFDPAMRAAMNTSIIFRTKFEGDLDAISRIVGSEFSKLVPRFPVGYSIFHLADIGDPFVLAWRPTYSQP